MNRQGFQFAWKSVYEPGCERALCLVFWHVQVTLVGMVHDKDERNIDTSFMLDDTTGRIEIKRW
jgi:hypothetical protein